MLKHYRPSRLTVALVAFPFGLWLGYLSAVQVVQDCLHAGTPEIAVFACPDWLTDPDSVAVVTEHDPEHDP
jgi:hypothetical protein